MAFCIDCRVSHRLVNLNPDTEATVTHSVSPCTVIFPRLMLNVSLFK